MQRLGAGVLLSLMMGTAFLGCGGGAAGPTISIALSPSEVSLTRGGVAQITAQALDANNNVVVTPTLAYHCIQLPSQTACSASNSPISVSNNGLICAGQWDANATRCYECSNPDLTTNQCPANNAIPLPLGSASITATATVNNTVVTSSAVVVTDHWPIDSVQVCSVDPSTLARTCPASATNCFSQNAKAEYAAEAFSKDPVACQSITGSSSVPCRIPDGTQPGSTNTIGSINWQVSPAQVATADATLHVPSEPVTVTATGPGQGVVGASIGAGGSAVSGSAPFTTCAVASIHVHQQNAPTGTDTPTFFTAPVGAAVPLVADVLDTKNVALTSTLELTWLTSQPALASVNLGTVATVSPGTAEITAACLPPSCNVNMNLPIFSDDVVTANITGTPDSTVLVATSTAPPNSSSSNNLVPVDSGTNSPGTAFTLPANVTVNSMVLTPLGNFAFLGTTCAFGTTAASGAACSGLLRFDPTVSTVPVPVATITGKVLATDGTSVVLSDSANNKVLIASTIPAINATLTIPNATAAAISIDGSKIYIVSGSNLYVYSPGLPLRTINPPLSGTASTSSQGAAFFATGAMAYVADAAGDEAVSTCRDAIQSSSTAAVGSPTHIAAVPNATAMVDANPSANPPGIDEVDVAPNLANGACPPVMSNTSSSHSFPGVSGFTARQLLITPNSQLAIILSDQGVLVYNLGSKQTLVVALANGAKPLTGGVTPNSANLYVGASDGAVHRVDLTKTPPTDAQTIAVNLCPSLGGGCAPDFVVVRPVATVATLRSMAVTPANPMIGVGAAQQFTATGTFSDNTTRDMTNFVTWTSSNPVVAIIGPNTTVTPPLAPGQARALAVGTSTITATSAGVSGSTLLTVQ